MKKILFTAFCISFLLPNITSADEDFLRFVFQNHCEESNTQCEKEISENKEAEVFHKQDVSSQAFTLDLVIENPKREMITSVRAKLKYDPQMIEIVDLDTEESDFPLAAPGENDVNKEEGSIIIGRSFMGGSKSDLEFLVASITVQPLVPGSRIEFMNYQDSELGDTGIFFTSGITTENRLKEEPNPLQIGGTITATGAGSGNGGVVQPGTGNIGAPGVPVTIPAPGDFNTQPVTSLPTQRNTLLPRPVDLKVQTDETGSTKLIWPITTDPAVKGYYLYYGQKSGFYLRRRDVGMTNFAVFPDLPRGSKYYFAISAYNEFDQESDYSDEVFATVGLPGSESHGFTGDPEATTQVPDTTNGMGGDDTQKPTISPENIDRTTDSGPEHILFFVIISLGLGMVTYSFRKA